MLFRSQLTKQINKNQHALWVAAGVLGLLGVLPGMPHLSFIGFAALFGGLGWTKPPGRVASVKLDIVPKEDGSTVLDNLNISGYDIDIRGGIALDANQGLKQFYFSDFSVNSLSHVEITANVRDDEVLEIKATGPSYDGREFF